MCGESRKHGSEWEGSGSNVTPRPYPEANASEFESWAGAVSGKLGQRTEKSFEVVDAGVQIFEKKKPQEPKAESTLVGTAPAPVL